MMKRSKPMKQLQSFLIVSLALSSTTWEAGLRNMYNAREGTHAPALAPDRGGQVLSSPGTADRAIRRMQRESSRRELIRDSREAASAARPGTQQRGDSKPVIR